MALVPKREEQEEKWQRKGGMRVLQQKELTFSAKPAPAGTLEWGSGEGGGLRLSLAFSGGT